MNTQNSRSKMLLNKVYDHLDGIDVSTLSYSELKDFVEVVQKCQFLEASGQIPSFGFGKFGGCATPPVTSCESPTEETK